jgi:hypothetical protein
VKRCTDRLATLEQNVQIDIPDWQSKVEKNLQDNMSSVITSIHNLDLHATEQQQRAADAKSSDSPDLGGGDQVETDGPHSAHQGSLEKPANNNSCADMAGGDGQQLADQHERALNAQRQQVAFLESTMSALRVKFDSLEQRYTTAERHIYNLANDGSFVIHGPLLDGGSVSVVFPPALPR